MAFLDRCYRHEIGFANNCDCIHNHRLMECCSNFGERNVTRFTAKLFTLELY